MKGFRKKFCVFLLLCFLATIRPVLSQTTFVFKGNKTRALISFTKAKDLIIVTTFINHKGPFNFILDTGVGLILITDSTLKDSLNLPFIRKINIKGLGEGEDIEAYLTSNLKVEIGPTVAENASAAILENDIFNLSTYAGIPIHGLIGFDFFNSFIVKINYQSNFINISNKETPRLIKKGHKIPITIEQNKPYIIAYGDVKAKKKVPLKMVIDTGAGHPISLESSNGSAFLLPDKFVSANLGVGLGGKINGYIGRIESFRIGNFEIKNPICSFPLYNDVGAKVTTTHRSGSIGNELLKKFEVTFNYQKKYLFLKANSTFKEPFEHDMSGIELYATGADFKRYFINRIEKQSPAEEIGLQVDDELLKINFKPTHEMTFSEITEIFKSKDGRDLILEIKHEEKISIGVIKLRRRI
jgi:hypothetical protein